MFYVTETRKKIDMTGYFKIIKLSLFIAYVYERKIKINVNQTIRKQTNHAVANIQKKFNRTGQIKLVDLAKIRK